MKEILRRIRFRPYRKGQGPSFRLTLWDCNEFKPPNHHRLGYRLEMLDEYTGPGCSPSFRTILFEGEDFGCPRGTPVDSDSVVESIMTFLTLKPGDTDQDYFEDYTPEQLDYCSQHAEALDMEVEHRFRKEDA